MTAHRPSQAVLRMAAVLAVLVLAACGSAPKKASAPSPAKGDRVASPSAPDGRCSGVSPYAPAQEDPSTRGDYTAGGLYKPGVPDRTPDYVPDVDCIPEPVVVDLPRSPVGNRSPYTVLGKQYKVMDRPHGYVEQGIASYYGSKFHGRRTSNQEVYDMYTFSAAHKTLPLPSFARVTNLDNGKSVVVRVNDRGPFHDGRVIDLSYAAAVKLGIVARGTGRVEVRALKPGEKPASFAAAQPAPPKQIAAAPAPKSGSGMDQLVGVLPVKGAAQSAATATLTDAAQPAPVAHAAYAQAESLPSAVAADAPARDLRFQVRSEGKTASADDFDAWLAAQGLRIIGGKVVRVASAAGAAATTAAAASLAYPQALAAVTEDVVLQVASFANRDNADRALERLLAAGIGNPRVSSFASNGRTMWRVRVSAPGTQAAYALANRISGLGFQRPMLAWD